MDAVTAVSGSGPAYIFHFIESIHSAAVWISLPTETGKLLTLQTVYGAAVVANANSREIEELRQQVNSANGTTGAALSVLMTDGKLNRLLNDVAKAARDRSVEQRA